MTPFALLLQLAGLSQREAATFLNVSPSSVDKMARGIRSTPSGVVDELRSLIAAQARTAGEFLDMIEEQSPDEIELGYPADDYEAQSLGWPSVGAWATMAARVIAEADCTVVLVPRGSTAVTAAAADIHDIERP